MQGPQGEIDSRPRRFYSEASTAPGADGWGVELDGRPLRTPAGRFLTLPTEALAVLIAGEWARQGERLDLLAMIGTRLANVALDRMSEARDGAADEIARYAGSDLVCYLADHPEALRQKQESVFAPLRAWFSAEIGARLSSVEGIMPQQQDANALDRVRAYSLTLDDFRLTGLAHGVALLGSAVLGIALERGRLEADAAHAAGRIDEEFQAAQWGEDAEAARLASARLAETRLLQQWFAALNQSAA